MRKSILTLTAILTILTMASSALRAQSVPREVMEEVYSRARTPYKYGLVVAPEDNFHKTDCPTVFRYGGRWYMTYLLYSDQGNPEKNGYQTCLAVSDDLLHWEKLGILLPFMEKGWDSSQRAGYMALLDYNWGGSYELSKYKGQYWMSGFGGHNEGYEKMPLSIGIASTRKSPDRWISGGRSSWKGSRAPALSSSDPDVQWWDSLVQYKTNVFEDPDRRFGSRFLMFYNAGGINPANGLKAERIGLALSDDMRHWRRYGDNPVFAHEQQGIITGDAHIQKMGDLWVMFYFGAFRKDRPYQAFNTFAASYDLLHWTDWDGQDLIYPTEDYDAMFAHKSCIIVHEGVVYHFYCAVDDDSQRGIAVATSRDMGRSEVHFPAGTGWIGATTTASREDSLSRRSIMLRHELSLHSDIESATVQISGLGFYELYVNGAKVNTHMLDPYWSEYDKTVYYNTFDLKPFLREGRNAFGVMLGNGFWNVQGGRYTKYKGTYGPPTLWAKLKVRYKDGGSATFTTGGDWKWSPSPVTFNCIYGGEDYDARLEQPGWAEPGFDDSAWLPVVKQTPPKGTLREQKSPSDTVIAVYSPAKAGMTAKGLVLDMQQNLSGIPSIRVSGKAGQTLRIYPAEKLDAEGIPDQKPTGSPHYYQYTLKGEGTEEWTPRFSYYGFRWLRIEGAVMEGMANPDGLPVLHSVQSLFTSNAMAETGSFSCSNEIFNGAHRLIRNAIRSNAHAVFTDCPHREKLGWLDQVQFNGPGLFYGYDLHDFARKVMQDMADAQHPDGMVPTTAPEYTTFTGQWEAFSISPEWGSAFIVWPLIYNRFYDDDSLVREYYDRMHAYLDWLGSKAVDGILDFGLGDWYDYAGGASGFAQNTPVNVVASAQYYLDILAMKEASLLTGRSDEAARLDSLAALTRRQYNDAFFHSEGGRAWYGNGSQACNAVALHLGLVPEGWHDAVLESLLEDIRAHGNRLTTGEITSRALYEVLYREGLDDVMFAIHNHYDAPGYGRQLAVGATTLTEQWDPVQGNSQNHFMLGHLEEWLYYALAGIHHEAHGAVTVAPRVIGDVSWVKASTLVKGGLLEVSWKLSPDGNFVLEVNVPDGAEVRVTMPDGSARGLCHSGLNRFESGPRASDPRPWAIWYWMYGTGTPEAVTADLEAMKKAGIAGAYLMPIKAPDPKYTPSHPQLSPEWDALVAHAIREAARTGIQLGIHICDGFALAGGPWITPEQSMQKIVSSSIDVAGGHVDAVLPRPETIEGWYKDLKVFAYRADAPARTGHFTTNPPLRGFKSSQPCSIAIDFDEPFTARSMYIKPRGNSVQAYRVLVEAADGQGVFHPVRQLEPPRLGWQSLGIGLTYRLPETTARHWRLSWTPSGSEPGSEDLDAAKWLPSLAIDELAFSSERKLDLWEGKAALTWAVGPEDSFEDGAVAAASLIDLTSSLDGDRITATLPSDGNWRILRIGHTSTGQINTTGGAGRGLECDKFSRDAVRRQLDGWFGHIWNLVDPETARKAISRMHVDSWECASQNWSEDFAAEFKARRGYDLMPWLPVMTGMVLDSPAATEKVLRDVRETIAELIHDVFYTELHDRAASLGLQLSAECTAPTMPGDGLLHYDLTELPMGEFWLRSPTHDKPNDMFDAISGGHIYGHNLIQAEGLTELRTLFDEDPALVKPLLDRNWASGFNALAFHVWVLNPWMDRRPGMSLDGIGFAMQRDQAWMPLAGALTGYVTRCQNLLQAGRPAIDIAVFTGEEVPRRSVLPDKLVASLPGPMGAARVASEKERLSDKGLGRTTLPQGVNWTSGTYLGEDWVNPLDGYQYDSFNPDVLRGATARDGKMVLPSGASYSLVIFPLPHKMSPGADRLSPWILYKIAELRKGGCTVLTPSELPYTQPDFSALGLEPDLKVISRVLDGGVAVSGAAGAAGAAFGAGAAGVSGGEGAGTAGDAAVSGASGEDLRGEIAWTHRTDGDREIYFIATQGGRKATWTLSLRGADDSPEVYDPARDAMKAIVNAAVVPSGSGTDAAVGAGRTIVTIELDADETCFVILGPGGTFRTRGSVDELPLQTGQWEIAFRETGVSLTEEALHDWTLAADPRVKYYSGLATYSTSFDWSGDDWSGSERTGSDRSGSERSGSDKSGSDKSEDAGRIYLRLNIPSGLAGVRVNGKDCGYAWTEPWTVDVTDALVNGLNQLEIDYANTWYNAILGTSEGNAPFDGVWTSGRYWELRPKELIPSGILGVSLIREKP
ncbi:MAG: family 78 glycoside hydrolase catalytic domain [Bacteroidales bacterium]|nr:family 78 glycoside hydrolase catalytic domain [Bacteroidales bacterium]